MTVTDEIIRRINELERRVQIINSDQPGGIWNFLASPLTSTSWNGDDAYSTTAKTLIDLSAVFGVPAGVKAVLLRTEIRDSASASNDCFLFLSPNDTANSGLMTACSGIANDFLVRGTHIIPCNADGDIYYQIVASGAGTMDVKIEIFGWLY